MVDHALEVVHVAHVRLHPGRPVAERLDLVLELLGGVLLGDVIDDDVGVPPGERQRDGLADAAVPARDDRDPAFESHTCPLAGSIVSEVSADSVAIRARRRHPMRVMTPSSRPSKVGPAARGETSGMSNYPPIADHGLIGDLQTAALVTTDGTVDWFCCPRFDSPSVFASLLDERKGGHFAIHAVDDCVTKQMYLPDTAVLVTRFLSPKGVAEVMDFMPLEKPGVVTDHHRLARAVRGIRGELDFEADIRPRFDYGRESHTTQVTGTDAVFEAPSLTLHLTGTIPLEEHNGDVRSRFTVRAGDFTGVVLESAQKSEIGHGEMIQVFSDTVEYWKAWLHTSTYRGRWREAVARSEIGRAHV